MIYGPNGQPAQIDTTEATFGSVKITFFENAENVPRFTDEAQRFVAELSNLPAIVEGVKPDSWAAVVATANVLSRNAAILAQLCQWTQMLLVATNALMHQSVLDRERIDALEAQARQRDAN